MIPTFREKKAINWVSGRFPGYSKFLPEGLDFMPCYQLRDLLTVNWEMAQGSWTYSMPCEFQSQESRSCVNGRWWCPGLRATIYSEQPLLVASWISHLFIHLHSKGIQQAFIEKLFVSLVASYTCERDGCCPHSLGVHSLSLVDGYTKLAF